MKRLVTILLMSICTLAISAQKDVTTFLGFPVDGTVNEMRKNLISKGFTPKQSQDGEYFNGEFNGTKVHVYIATNNNKVCRIMLCDEDTRSEADIKIRFNNLVHQFENNKRYVQLNDDQTIADDVDISYEMSVKNKVFDALFYQTIVPEKIDTIAVQNMVQKELLEKYKEEELQNPTEEIVKDIQNAVLKVGLDVLCKKAVWFRISEYAGKYYITMYYDNEYNRANGEDL